jgi:hypothetical protein
MNGTEFIAGVRQRLIETGVSGTDHQVAEYLGMNRQSVQNWKNRPEITVQQVLKLLERVEERAKARTAHRAIRPIVEFFQISKVASRQNAKLEVFSPMDADGVVHPHLVGLRDELRAHHGIYVFHDSRGRGLYAGKAQRLKLWNELNNAFNRDRAVQKIRRVDHPSRRQDYRTSDEIRRQIRSRKVPLSDLAFYVSAYEVEDGMIGDLEAFLIRAFPNDLLNVKMENFA